MNWGKFAVSWASLGLAAVAAAPLAAQAPRIQSAAVNRTPELPPLQFSAINPFLDAIAIDDAAANIIDLFWQPAIAAFVAANPDKADAARAFAIEHRAKELAVYRPLVALLLDRRVIELLDPKVRRRHAELLDEMSAEVRRKPSSQERQRAIALKAQRITSDAIPGVKADLEAITHLALTPDGVALRELNQRGLFLCVPWNDQAVPRRQGTKECDRLTTSPVLERLRGAPRGDKLILLSAAAHVQLSAMTSMAHDPGISLYRLIPPAEALTAGLKVPADQSFEELIRAGAR